MILHSPPFYRYSLFEQWDKETFNRLKEIGKSKNYPKIIGSTKDKNQFLITLIRAQKSLHDWRDFLKDILKQVKENNVVDTFSLNKKYPPESIGKDVPDWVTYEGDKIVNNFIDELEIRKITFHGTDEEISEFVMRFILGQLGHDWEQTIMMVWEMTKDKSVLSLKELNKEMKNFDYLKLFE
ncbi:hypothetical protein A3I50_02975 [Candidatus Roizmanbacteria bacterium RIFCSPLOWO2_02_FULL_37_9]|nr:MAG: hypothetical protein A3F57_03330 [Candidatus Roizmanbacteria bacterium RIFCSPHIGHO2_12_FULL_36_11]OGK55841.1 MAG: hypothetical protein A3I50_02975 [Candidatus Roizmanbacteria bacterium RIFCSPLOWO2_02_FULL_37_9]